MDKSEGSRGPDVQVHVSRSCLNQEVTGLTQHPEVSFPFSFCFLFGRRPCGCWLTEPGWESPVTVPTAVDLIY